MHYPVNIPFMLGRTQSMCHHIFTHRMRKDLEIFFKTKVQNHSRTLNSIVWEEDPTRHREALEGLSSAFGSHSVEPYSP